MSYNTVAEADSALGYLDAWTALEADGKTRALDTAFLWLTSNYALPATPTAAELVAIKGAELAAVRYHLVEPLFGTPGTADKGALIRERIKADVIEEEFQYATPTSPRTGPALVPEADAWLLGIAVARGAAPVPAILVV